MKITFVIILVTFATAIARQDPPLVATTKSSSYVSLGQELRGLLVKAGSMWSFPTSVNETMHHASKHRPSHKARSVHGGKSTAKGSVNCISASVCEKKKMICTKLCSKARVNTDHLANKCYIKCSKCKPTC